MKTEEQILSKIRKIEQDIMDRFRKGHNQARLKDIGELQALRWVLDEEGDVEEWID